MKELIVVKNKKDKIKDYLIYFFTYACIGWILETIYAFLVHGKFVNRGFLFVSYCPIYGFGALILIMLLKNVKGKPIQEFFVAAIAFTIFEYMASYILEVIFGLRWWDYTEDLLNLQGRVSLAYSILWGLMGIFLIEVMHPFVEKTILKIRRKIKHKYGNIILILLVLMLLVDLLFSSVKYLK